MRALAYEKITTMTSSTALSTSTYDKSARGSGADAWDTGTKGGAFRLLRPTKALLTVETAAVRFTTDGTVPTVTAGTGAGHIAYAGDMLELDTYDDIKTFRAINEVASNGAVLRATYYYE